MYWVELKNKGIVDLSYGLKCVLKLCPTEYLWKGKAQEHKSLGSIAQEVNEVIQEQNYIINNAV